MVCANPLIRRPPSGDARLAGYALRHRRGWGLSMLLAAAAGLTALLQPWPMQVLIDHVLGAAPMPPWLAELTEGYGRPALLAWVGLATLAAYAAAALLEAASAYAVVRVGQSTTLQVARQLFTHILRQAQGFFHRHTTGDLLARITGDSWYVYKALDALLITAGRALLVSLGMAAILWRENPRLALVAIATTPALGLAAFVLRHRMRSATRQRRDIEGRIQSHVQQTLRGIWVVQAFAREEHEHGRFQRFAVEVIRAQQRGLMLRNISTLWSGLTRTLGIGLILLLGAREVLGGALTIGKLWVFLVYLRSMLVQFETLVSAYTTTQEIRAERDRVAEVLDDAPEIADAPDAKPLQSVRGEVRLENVTFGYDPATPILRDVDLTARPGHTVAIVGATGAGKTTLVNLIPRFFDPQHGRVLLDGCDVRTLRLADLRRHVALVLQDPHLLPMSVAQNIAYGRPDAPRDRVTAAATAANADAFIRALPEGYDTVIGERGATLSGGERQRIAIARAILKDAPVLILDEPTSALDTHTEAAVMQALERLMAGRTTLVIAHRLTTVRRADHIVVLEAGRIIEQGTHEQLVANSGHYKRLCDLQLAPPPEGSA